MIDHVYLPVSDVSKSRTFYRELLAPVGVSESFVVGESVGFGVGKPGALWLYPPVTPPEATACRLSPDATRLPHLHICFRAESRAQVESFHTTAIRLGAEVIEAPRLFPDYHPNYFATFVRDLDGHNIEAVCHSG